ncbi:hypothetical protein BgiMline_021447, partial [Biomphalaria glabrata]
MTQSTAGKPRPFYTLYIGGFQNRRHGRLVHTADGTTNCTPLSHPSTRGLSCGVSRERSEVIVNVLAGRVHP